MRAVDDAVARNEAFIAMENPYHVAYIQALNPRHHLPARQKRLKICDCSVFCEKEEMKKIILERASVLHGKFVTVNSDFVWCSELKSHYGSITINLTAKKYLFKDGIEYFCSEKTAKEFEELGQLASPEPSIDMLEYLLAFEEFNDAHTGTNISQWLERNLSGYGISPDFQRHLTTDGASNAKKSISDLKLVVYGAKTDSDISTSTCDGHSGNLGMMYAIGFLGSGNKE